MDSARCVVKGCGWRWTGKHDNTIFFRFPGFNVPVAREAWLSNVNLGSNYKPGRNDFVCEKHFIEGRPTTSNPYPEQVMGWDCPKRSAVVSERMDEMNRPTITLLAKQQIIERSGRIEARRHLGLPDELTPEEKKLGLANGDATIIDNKQPVAKKPHCAAAACPNSIYVLRRMGLTCSAPLFPFSYSKDEATRREWLKFAQSKTKNLTRGFLCALHFKDGRPTPENPVPTIHPKFDWCRDSVTSANSCSKNEVEKTSDQPNSIEIPEIPDRPIIKIQSISNANHSSQDKPVKILSAAGKAYYVVANRRTLNGGDGEVTLHNDKISLNDGKVALHDDKIGLHDGTIALRDNKIGLHKDEIALCDNKIGLNCDQIGLHSVEIGLQPSAPQRNYIALLKRLEIEKSCFDLTGLSRCSFNAFLDYSEEFYDDDDRRIECGRLNRRMIFTAILLRLNSAQNDDSLVANFDVTSDELNALVALHVPVVAKHAGRLIICPKTLSSAHLNRCDSRKICGVFHVVSLSDVRRYAVIFNLQGAIMYCKSFKNRRNYSFAKIAKIALDEFCATYRATSLDFSIDDGSFISETSLLRKDDRLTIVKRTSRLSDVIKNVYASRLSRFAFIGADREKLNHFVKSYGDDSIECFIVISCCLVNLMPSVDSHSIFRV